MTAMKIGLIGAGVISEQYLENLTKAKSVSVEMVSDLDVSRSEQRAKQYGIATFGTPEQLLARDDIELIVNLTIPKAHEQVTVAALKAGKHVWSEKPLALDKLAAGRIRQQAKQSGREVGCAPDTFLGPGIQTGLRLIREGRIGKVTGATCRPSTPSLRATTSTASRRSFRTRTTPSTTSGRTTTPPASAC